MLSNAGVIALNGGGGITVSDNTGAITLGSNATSANTANTIVMRDGNRNFSGGVITGEGFTGSGAGVTNLNASNLDAGTLPDPRLSGTYGGALTLSNPGNNIAGRFTGTTDADLQGNLLKNPAFGMLLYHPMDSIVRLQTGANQSGGSSYLGNVGTTMRLSIERPGSFLSLRASWSNVVAGHVFYILAGSDSRANGMGFKGVGTALKGVTIEGGVETEVDLATSLNQSQPLTLLSLRRESSVEFYVDGALKGSSSTNLPSIIDRPCWLSADNTNTNSTNGILIVGYLTIGSPMFP